MSNPIEMTGFDEFGGRSGRKANRKANRASRKAERRENRRNNGFGRRLLRLTPIGRLALKRKKGNQTVVEEETKPLDTTTTPESTQETVKPVGGIKGLFGKMAAEITETTPKTEAKTEIPMGSEGKPMASGGGGGSFGGGGGSGGGSQQETAEAPQEEEETQEDEPTTTTTPAKDDKAKSAKKKKMLMIAIAILALIAIAGVVFFFMRTKTT